VRGDNTSHNGVGDSVALVGLDVLELLEEFLEDGVRVGLRMNFTKEEEEEQVMDISEALMNH
jgi:hypothetical protein